MRFGMAVLIDEGPHEGTRDLPAAHSSPKDEVSGGRGTWSGVAPGHRPGKIGADPAMTSIPTRCKYLWKVLPKALVAPWPPAHSDPRSFRFSTPVRRGMSTDPAEQIYVQVSVERPRNGR